MIDNKRAYMLKLEDKVPDSFTMNRMSSADFSNTLTSFLDEYFRGAIDVVTDGCPFGSVLIAPEGAAYLIRLILKEVYGKYLVSASIILGQGDVRIKIKHRERSLNFDYITKIAKKSGFSILEDNDHTLILSAKVEPEKRLVLYAISGASWHKLLIHYVLSE